MNRKLSIVTSASALVVGAALVLTGCASHGSTNAAGTSSSNGQSQSQGQRQGQGGFAGQGGGGTFGQIAAVDGTTLQVQDASSQTAVSYSTSTKISKTVSVALSAVKVGECITASTTPASGSPSSSSTSSDAAVTSVAISQPSGGSCTTGFGGQRGAGGQGGQGGQGGPRPTDRAGSRPSVRPSGAASGRFGGGNFVMPTSGKVTAVSGSTITVDALDFQTQKTSSKKVTVDESTTYTETQTGAASDLVVGQCVIALGKADDSGTVTATALTVSAPVNGSCTTGFGGRGFGSGRPGGDNASQNGTSNG